MRAINIITVKRNQVKDIETFPIWKEHLSYDVVEKANKLFESKIIEHGADPNDEFEFNSYIENGFYETQDISITWMWTTIN